MRTLSTIIIFVALSVVSFVAAQTTTFTPANDFANVYVSIDTNFYQVEILEQKGSSRIMVTKTVSLFGTFSTDLVSVVEKSSRYNVVTNGNTINIETPKSILIVKGQTLTEKVKITISSPIPVVIL